MAEQIPSVDEGLSVDQMLSAHIDDLMSLEHGECSRVSSEVNHKVNLLFQQSRGYVVTRDLYPADGKRDSHRSLSAQVVKPRHDDIVVEGEKIQLAFVRPVISEKLQHTDESAGLISSIGRRVVASAGLEKFGRRYDDPQFGALIEGSIFVPLAGFRHKQGAGDCSYIQLGSGEMGQMSDEDLYVVVKDEEGQRHQIVESLRDLVKGRIEEWLPEDKKFQDFIVQEIEKHREAVVDGREAALTRLCFDVLKKEGQPRKLLVVDEEDGGTPEKIESAYQISRCNNVRLDESGREVRFELASGGGSSGLDSATLYAVTRQDVSIPLVKMNKNNSSIDYTVSGLDVAERLKAVRLFTDLIKRNLPDSKRPFTVGRSIEGVTVTAVALQEEGLMDRNGLKALYRDANQAYDKVGHSDYPDYQELVNFGDYVKKAVKSKKTPWFVSKENVEMVRDYIQSPWRKEKPRFSNHGLLELGLRKKKGAEKILNGLAELFDVNERFDKALGNTDPKQEILFETILEMADVAEPVTAEVRDFPLKSTKVDLEFTAHASRDEESKFNFTINCKPVGRPDIEKAGYVKIVGDKLLPLFSGSSTGNMPDSDYAAIVYRLLSRMGI
jgi:hypothetical protein